MRTSRLIRTKIALAAAVALAAPTGAPATAGTALPGLGYTIGIHCEGFGAHMPADSDAVRIWGRVPEHFRLAGEQAGVAFVNVYTGACELVSLDGRSMSVPYLFSQVGVVTESHPGGYDLWQLTDERRFWHLLRRFDMRSAVVDDMTVEFHDHIGGVPSRAHATVPWAESPYTVEAALLPSNAPFPPVHLCWDDGPSVEAANPCIPSEHWSHGRHGTVFSPHANCRLEFAPATLTITTGPGSPLQRIIGEQVTVEGVWGHLELLARTDLEERFLSGDASRPSCG